MKKDKNYQLRMIENWMNCFPCQSYFGKSVCILELIEPLQIKKLIDENYKLSLLYKEADIIT